MARVKVLLWCGLVGGPLFLAVFLLNDRFKADYDPVRDYVSEASIGPGGWVQIANFLVTGALVVAFSLAARRVVSRWTGILLTLFGAGLMLAGVFVTDPAPYGHRTPHGIAHDLISLVVFTSLPAAAFTAARWRPTRLWRAYCYAVGISIPILLAIFTASSTAGGVFQRLTITVAMTWCAALALRALKTLSPVRPDGAPEAGSQPSAPPLTQTRPPASQGRSAPLA